MNTQKVNKHRNDGLEKLRPPVYRSSLTWVTNHRHVLRQGQQQANKSNFPCPYCTLFIAMIKSEMLKLVRALQFYLAHTPFSLIVHTMKELPQCISLSELLI